VSFTVPALRAELTDFLKGLIYLYRHFGSVALQLSTNFFFLFVAIGVGLDHMGWGQKIAGASAQVLNRYARQRADFISEVLAQRTFAASFTLAMVVYFYGEIGRTVVSGPKAMGLLGIGAGLYLTCFLVIALLGGERDGVFPMRFRILRRIVGALHWSALVSVTAAVIFGMVGQIIEGLGPPGSLSIGGIAAPLTFVAFALLACVFAFRSQSTPGTRPLRLAFAALPVLTVNWLMIVEGFSPGFAAWWSVLVLFLCILGWRTMGTRSDRRFAAASRLLTIDMPGLCISTARFMTGVALVAAFYCLIALWWFVVLGTRIM
jgi:hypothetical protein